MGSHAFEPAGMPGMRARRRKGMSRMQEELQYAVLHEFVAPARRNLSRQTWDYLMGGAETETTYVRNRVALDSLAFRPRVLRNVEKVDTGGKLLGQKLRMPVILAPIGSLQDIVAEGGAGADARPPRATACMHMLSSACSPGLEAVAAGNDHPKIFQLYVRGDAGLGRRPRRARHRQPLRRAVPHRRSRLLRPPRARPRQALQGDGAAGRAGRPFPGALLLGRRRAAARRSSRSPSSSRASPRPRMPGSPSSTASRRLRVQPRRPPARPRQGRHGRAAGGGGGGRRGAPRSSSTAASCAAPTSSRPWRSAPMPSASAGCRAWRSAAGGVGALVRALELLEDEMRALPRPARRHVLRRAGQAATSRPSRRCPARAGTAPSRC